MPAGNSPSRTAKTFVSALIKRLTMQRWRGPLSTTSYLSPGARRNCVLVSLARAWCVTTLSVVLLSAAVSLAPVWDSGIFVKSLLEALNTDPEMLQLSVASDGALDVDGGTHGD